MLHIGYILWLDSFDRDDEEYGTVMARFLKNIKERGIKTSIDVVSYSAADYKSKIVHSKEAGFCLDVASYEFTSVASVAIPKSEIKGRVGAGTLFALPDRIF